ncbi:MAG: hypothetical protein ACT4QD_06290 [Acidobacteriota bacterium]
MYRPLLALAVVLVLAQSVEAQPLKLAIQDGRVSLDATAVPIRQILAEWARVGGTRIVGADKMTGGPLTLTLVDMPERQALDILLRNAAGFMAAPRSPAAPPGASQYDRILILATTSAPAPAAGGAARGASSAPVPPGRRLPPRPPNLPPSPADVADDDPPEAMEQDAADTGVTQPVFTFPAPPGPVGGNPSFVPFQPNQPIGNQPVITLQPNPTGPPSVYTFTPTPDGMVAPPSSQPGFTTIGSPTPGLIQQPATPTAPGQTPRPPPR